MVERKVKGVAEVAKERSVLLERVLGKPAEAVIGVEKTKEGWKALVEVVERKAIPETQDLIDRYELVLNKDGKLLRYHQVRVRCRSDREGLEF